MIKQLEVAEVQALRAGVAVNLLMSAAGWIAYYLSNSEALLLDGNFSFITTIATVTAILIARKKHQKTSLFPYGRYFYESFFVLFKGLLILGLTIAALFQNIIKIFDYLSGQPIVRLEPGIILYYSALMTLLSFGLAIYYRYKNKSVDYGSSLLSVEFKSAKIDGYLSMIIGIALFLTTIVPENSKFGFLLYIGDAIIVISFSLFLLKIPLDIIKEGFIELGGGILQDKEARELVEGEIARMLPQEFALQNEYITKLGSSYLIIVYLDPIMETISMKELQHFRTGIRNSLIPTFPNLQVEVVIGN